MIARKAFNLHARLKKKTAKILTQQKVIILGLFGRKMHIYLRQTLFYKNAKNILHFIAKQGQMNRCDWSSEGHVNDDVILTLRSITYEVQCVKISYLRVCIFLIYDCTFVYKYIMHVTLWM